MSRVQLALRVADLEAAVDFYSRLFDATPAKRRPGYANFAIPEPPLKLVLLEGQPGQATVMDHLGVEVGSTDEVNAATKRLTAAGLPTDISKQHGVTFDLILMVVQAAIDGIGVAIGRTSYVQDDIAKGRLVVPFKITLPADAGFYLVSPEARADTPKLAAFRQWLIASVHDRA